MAVGNASADLGIPRIANLSRHREKMNTWALIVLTMLTNGDISSSYELRYRFNSLQDCEAVAKAAELNDTRHEFKTLCLRVLKPGEYSSDTKKDAP